MIGEVKWSPHEGQLIRVISREPEPQAADDQGGAGGEEAPATQRGESEMRGIRPQNPRGAGRSRMVCMMSAATGGHGRPPDGMNGGSRRDDDRLDVVRGARSRARRGAACARAARSRCRSLGGGADPDRGVVPSGVGETDDVVTDRLEGAQAGAWMSRPDGGGVGHGDEVAEGRVLAV